MLTLVHVVCTEIKFGKVLGVGGFCVVREIAAIECGQSPGISTNEEEARLAEESPLPSDVFMSEMVFQRNESDTEDQHYEIEKAKETMAERCIRKGEARYAAKYLLKTDLTELEQVRGRIDLAIEVKYLKALNHPSIVKMRGFYRTDNPLHNCFFFIMDRLYGTLEDRMGDWKAIDKVSQGSFFRKPDKHALKELFEERLVVAYDVASALRYMHSHKLVYR
jgi:serine/threonine protein kinase